MLRFLPYLLLGAGLHWSAFAQTCSKANPCKLGCCSQYGSCGYGEPYCGAGCQGTCNAKSECDPGWGPQYSQAEKCPLNVCCSKYGFCGTSSDFCGPNTLVPAPSCAGASATKRTIGYYEGWSYSRSCDSFLPEQLRTSAYTHINFAFAFIDPNTFAIAPMDAGQVPLYKRLTALKEHNPGLEVWISIGGWSMNNPNQPTARTFSQLAASVSYQQKFFSSLLTFLSTYGFDGVDIDWEYPVAPDRSGSPSDFDNYPVFVKNLRRALDSSGRKYGLSLTLPASYWYLRGFDIVNLEPSVDWFNMLTYDLHGVWDANDPYIGPIIGAHTNLTEINSALNLLWRNQISPGKVVLGLGFYGRSFTLKNPSCSSPGCGFTGGGSPGPCTQTSGVLSYAEIADKISAGANVRLDSAAAVKIATFEGNQWVSYDDGQTLKMKVDYANRNCLAGTMVWAMDLDTANGTEAGNLGLSTGQPNYSLSEHSLNHKDPLSICTWSYCAKAGAFSSPQCPSGTTSVQDVEGACPSGSYQSFCCPINNQPKCRVGPGALFCAGSCNSNEIEIGRTTDGCIVGSKPICCRLTSSDAPTGACKWYGIGPNCAPKGQSASCPAAMPVKVATSPGGQGGVACSTGAKAFCCTAPAPYVNCEWYRTIDGPYGNPGSDPDSPNPSRGYLKCNGRCTPNQVLVATSKATCLTGSRALCCDTPANTNDPRLIAFTAQMLSFQNNHTCPVSQMNDLSLTKLWQRDLQDNLTSSDLARRDFASAGGNNLAQLLTGIFQRNTYLGMFEADIFDEIIGPHNLHVDDYNQLLNFAYRGEEDPSAVIQEFLCDWDDAQEALDDFYASSNLCVNPSEGTRRMERGLEVKKLFKRRFRRSNGSSAPVSGNNPSITSGALLQAIIDNRIPLLYTRNIEYRSRARPDHTDNILEMAWDLTNAPDLQERRGIDIFAIIHAHIVAVRDFNGGPLYPAITYIGAYHGQYTHNYGQHFTTPTGQPAPGILWAVDHGYEPAARTAGSEVQRINVLQCDQDEVWYPGLNPAGGRSVGERRLESWGQAMRQRNILTDRMVFNYDPENHQFFYPDTDEWGLAVPTGNPADMSPAGGWPESPGPASGVLPP